MFPRIFVWGKKMFQIAEKDQIQSSDFLMSNHLHSIQPNTYNYANQRNRFYQEVISISIPPQNRLMLTNKY